MTGKTNAVLGVDACFTQAGSVSASASPVDFDDQTQDKWYKARGRNCEIAAPAPTPTKPNPLPSKCQTWSEWSNTIELPEPLDAPTSLTLSLNTGDYYRLELGFTQSSESTHYYQLELHRSDTQTGTFAKVGNSKNASASPTHFSKQTDGKWYKARARNCEDTARADCYTWSAWSNSILLPLVLDPPTALTLAVEDGDDDDLDLGFTRSGESTHFYQFELHQSNTKSGTFTKVATVSETTSPADFNNQTQGKWYKAQGRNCSTKARASCNDWSKWSNTIFLSTPPVFAKTAYSFSLVETSDLGTTVGTVSATDADSGDTVTYSITAGNTKGMFAISNSTGAILVYDYLDYETAATTTLTIQAQDSHGATGTTTVTVTTTNWFESLVTASTTTPLTGQSVTLTASTDVGSLPGAQYQWQRVDTTKNQWVNVGANTTTTTLTLTSATVATEVYRLKASFRSSNAAPSRPVTIEWQELAASITTNNPFPLSGDSKQRSATLTAHTNAPTGATYKWQKSPTTSTNWTDITSTKKTATVSSTVRTTKKYRVIVTSGTHTATSDAVFVTWDLGATLSDITDALAANFATPTATPNAGSNQEGATGQAANTTAFLTKEATLLKCVKDTSTSNGGGEYDSFAELMTQYTGKTKTLLNTAGSNGCSTELTETWTAITTAFTSTFTTISTTGSNAAANNAFLSSGPGKSFKKHMLASASLTNSIEDFIVPATNILENEPTPTPTPTPGAQGQDGARAQEEDGGSTDNFAEICLRVAGLTNEVAVKAASLDQRLKVLNCLVFQAPHSWWIDLARPIANKDADSTLLDEYKKNVIDPGDTDTEKKGLWLDGMDFECTWETNVRRGFTFFINRLLLPYLDFNNTEAELAGCLKHDIALGSLRLIDDAATDDDPDTAWNPRNKHLADALFYADAVCLDKAGIERHECLSNTEAFWDSAVIDWLKGTAAMRTGAVANLNNKGWPITAEHISHARQNPRYVECSQPFTKVDTSTLASQIGNDYITVSWTLIPSCVNEKIEKIVLTGVDPEATHGLTSELTNTPSTSAKIKKEHILPHAKILHHALIYPVNRKYGSLYFDQADLDFLISA